MNGVIILAILIAIISILVLIYFYCYVNLNGYKERIDNAEKLVQENLNKKLELITNSNKEIKKVTGKKDYLKEYLNIKELNNIEKDLKLEEAEKLINDLINDYSKLSKDKEFNNSMDKLKEIDEALVASKNLFNKNASLSNKLIKKFPYNIMSKISCFKIKSLYNNKTEDNETF